MKINVDFFANQGDHEKVWDEESTSMFKLTLHLYEDKLKQIASMTNE